MGHNVERIPRKVYEKELFRLLLAGVAALFAGAGRASFTLGLRRYTSGSVWTRP